MQARTKWGCSIMNSILCLTRWFIATLAGTCLCGLVYRSEHNLLKFASFVLLVAVSLCITDRVGFGERVDAFGDPLPEGALSRCGAQRWCPGERIQRAVVNPAGDTVAVVRTLYRQSRDRRNERSLELWDAKAGTVRALLYKGENGLSSPVFSASDAGVACLIRSRELVCFDMKSSAQKWSTLLKDEADLLAAANNANLIAVCAENDVSKVVFVEKRTGKHVASVEINPAPKEVFAIHFTTADNACVLSTSAGILRIGIRPDEFEKCERVTLANGILDNQVLSGGCISDDANQAAFFFENTVRVFDTNTGKELTAQRISVPAFQQDLLYSTPMAFAHKGKSVALPAFDCRCINIIDCQSAGIRVSTAFFDLPVIDISVAEDASRLVIATSERLHVIELAADSITELYNAHDGVVSAELSRDGTRVVSTGGGSVRSWNADGGNLEWQVDKVRCGILDPSSPRVFAIAGLDRVHTFNGRDATMTAETKLKTWDGGKVEFNDVVSQVFARGDSNELVYVVNNRTPWLWDFERDQCRALKKLEPQSELTLAVAAESGAVFAVSKGTYWTLADDGSWRRREVSRTNYTMGSAAVSPDGTLLACLAFHRLMNGDERFEVIVWSVDDSKIRRRVIVDDSCAQVILRSAFKSVPIAISPDNRDVAVGRDDGSIMLINITDGGVRTTAKAHLRYVSSVAFSANGRMVSGGADGVIYVWRGGKLSGK
jgi:WD40 repeat protein